MKSGTAINQTTLHSSTVSKQSEEQWELARSGAVLDQRACLRGAGAEQGRSRHTTITPVRAARPSGGPLPRYLVLHQSVPAARHFQSAPGRLIPYIKTAMPAATSVATVSTVHRVAQP
jgi:hypothetical protein